MTDLAMGVLTEAFYLPNEARLKKHYEKNVKLLRKYPYLFRKDFLKFEELPLRLYPFDEGQYIPYDCRNGRFGERTIPEEKIIRHHFFADLEKPVFAKNIFSQYELQYLRDNVRRSEDLGKENHVYLHYSDWGEFCAWLQVLEIRPLLEDQKLVFLMEEEENLYPIDFSARFGIDYSKYPLQPVRIREICRLIWHTQLSAHNGGDFFNEIFDAHPNLLCIPSIYLSEMEDSVETLRKGLEICRTLQDALSLFSFWENPDRVQELYTMHKPSDKDLMVALYLFQKKQTAQFLDPASRIVPAVFFQPHFPNVSQRIQANEQGYVTLETHHLDELHKSKMLQGFRYLKTFTPLRRFTTSYGGSIRFFINLARGPGKDENEPPEKEAIADLLSQRIANRSFMRDPDDPLYKDSIVVRFEDGKTNPKATFTALAAFLDLPYTESMTYCSSGGERDPYKELGDDLYAAGFSLSSVYKTYDEYATDSERAFIEYCFRDAYEYYGYDFHYYDGKPVDEERMRTWFADFGKINGFLREAQHIFWTQDAQRGIGPAMTPEEEDQAFDKAMETVYATRIKVAMIFSGEPKYINSRGEWLRMTPMLQLDPALLQTELYH